MRAIREKYGYPEKKMIEFHEHPLKWLDEWISEPESELKQVSRLLVILLVGIFLFMVAVGVLTWLIMAIPGWLTWLIPAGMAWAVYRWFRWAVRP